MLDAIRELVPNAQFTISTGDIVDRKSLTSRTCTHIDISLMTITDANWLVTKEYVPSRRPTTRH